MCGSCARMVVAPRPRVPVPVRGNRPPVAVPVQPGQQPMPQPVPVPVAQPGANPTAPAAAVPQAQPGTPSVSPWVANRTVAGETKGTITVELGATHDGGLLKRGVHTEIEHD